MEHNIHLFSFPDESRSIVFKNGTQIFAFDNQVYELLESLYNFEINFKDIDALRVTQLESNKLSFRSAVDMTYPEILKYVNGQENT